MLPLNFTLAYTCTVELRKGDSFVKYGFNDALLSAKLTSQTAQTALGTV
jgi:hypothetical protein